MFHFILKENPILQYKTFPRCSFCIDAVSKQRIFSKILDLDIYYPIIEVVNTSSVISFRLNDLGKRVQKLIERYGYSM